MRPTPPSRTASIRRLLEQLYPSDSELTAFCIDFFVEEVGREFAAGMTRTDKLNLLFSRVESSRLLTALQADARFASFAHLLQPPTRDAACPFPGLESFAEEQADLFAGRTHEVEELLTLLGQSPGRHVRWLQIEGSSGSGKSSLAHAGLLPAIRQRGLLGGPAQLAIAVMRPGRDPLRNLAAAVAQALDSPLSESLLAQSEKGLRDFLHSRLGSGQGLLLLVDQLEELFTVSAPGSESRFDALLAAALADVDLPLYLVTTIRSDFLIRFSQLPSLEQSLNRTARYHLRSLRAQQLREALLQMAQRTGLTFEKGLLERLLDDAARQDGSLPLIAHVLWELWHRRSDGVLTQASYDQLGGVIGALSQSADTLLHGLSLDGQKRAQRLLLSLVRIGHGSPDVKVAVPRLEVLRAAGDDAEAERVLAQLSGGRNPEAPATAVAPPRLLVVSGEKDDEASYRVELVHDALLQHWPTLTGWVEDNRKALQRRDEVESAAQVWAAADHPDEGLPGGKLLAYYEGSALPPSQRELASSFLSERARRFLTTAHAAQHRRGSLYRWRFALLLPLVVALLGTALWWWTHSRVHVRYYATTTARYGVSEGVVELNAEQRRHIDNSYRFSYRGGQLLSVERVNSHGQLRNDSSGYARWEYSYWNSGGVQEVTVRSRAGQVKIREVYSADGSRLEVRDAFHNPLSIAGGDISVYLIEWDTRGRMKRKRFTNIYGVSRFDSQNAFGYAYEYDERGLLVRTQPLGISGEPTSWKSGIASFVYQNDRWGFAKQLERFDASGQRTLDPTDRTAGWQQLSDEWGNVTELVYLGIDGKPMLSKHGYSTVRYVYDSLGNEIEYSYWGLDGKRALSADDQIAGAKMVHDDRGNVIKMAYLGLQGLPALSKNHEASIVTKYDSKDNKTEISYYDVNGNRTLNDDGYAFYRREFDEYGKKTWFGLFDINDRPVLSSYGYASCKLNYDSRGNLTESKYFDAAGKPTLRKGGYTVYQEKYNERNQKIQEAYFGVDDQPILIKEGYSSKSYTYDESGNKISDSYFGVHGEPILNKEGYATEFYRYDRLGQIVQHGFLNIEGQPVLSINEGIHGYSYKYDERGNNTEATYIGLDGKPTYCAHGNVTHVYKYDDRGNVLMKIELGLDRNPHYQPDGDVGKSSKFDIYNRMIESTHLDPQLKPTLCKHGHAIHHQKHDARGNVIEVRVTDVQNNPVMDKDGYSSVHYKFDERSNKIETDYFDTAGKKVLNKDGNVAQISFKFDVYNNKIEEAYFGIDGQPRESKEGYAVEATKYDERRNPIAIEYFGARGQPTLTKQGYAAIRKEYNALGWVIAASYFGLDGQPILNQDGVARIEFRYDALENVTAESTFGMDGKPRLSKKGYAAVRFTYDEHHLKVQTTYLGIDGRPTLSDEGVAIVRSQYDARGLLARESCFDQNDRPILHKKGYAVLVTQHDARGREASQTLLGLDGKPRVGSDGYATRSSRYDARGNLLEQSFFGIDNRPIMTTQSGAGFIAAYDLPDQELRKIFYDTNRAPIRGTGKDLRWRVVAGNPLVEQDGAASRPGKAAIDRARAYLASYSAERLRQSQPALFRDARGLLVTAAIPSAVLSPGDVLLFLNGQRLSAPAELSLESRGAPHELVKLDVLRGGRRIELQVAREQLTLSTEPL